MDIITAVTTTKEATIIDGIVDGATGEGSIIIEINGMTVEDTIHGATDHDQNHVRDRMTVVTHARGHHLMIDHDHAAEAEITNVEELDPEVIENQDRIRHLLKPLTRRNRKKRKVL